MQDRKRPSKETFFLALLCSLMVMGFVGLCVVQPFSAPIAEARAVVTPGSFSPLVKKASPSVVNISTVKTVEGHGWGFYPFNRGEDPFKDFFEKFFGERAPKKFKQQSLGSGFIIDKEGFILTNNHVVEKTDEITVTLADERQFRAKIIGRDSKTDLALIRMEADVHLEPLPLGDSDKLEVGDWVVAIGNPFGLGNTVTAGIVSAKGRTIGAGPYDDFIQTDASINPGNSGGPLLNASGEVVGINAAIFSQTGGSIGIGFAIPINMAKDLLPQLKEGKVVRGWLGVMIQKITPELKEKLGLKDEKGALVGDVTEDGPADKAGIKRGDVIISFDGKEVGHFDDLPYLVASTPVGEKVTVEVIRKGEKKGLTVKIGELVEAKRVSEGGKEAEPELGLTVSEITPELVRNFGLSQKSGLVVVEVESNSPGAAAGLRPGDVILEVDQEPVKDLAQFKKKIAGYKEGDTILFLIDRKGVTLYLTLQAKK